jgi:putative ABC transport system permease protein
VAAVNGIPLLTTPFQLPFTIAGRPAPETTEPLPVVVRLVSPDFFQMFGVPLRRGRTLTEQDRTGSGLVVMVNEQFVNTYLAGVDPIMQEIVVPGGPPPNPPLKLQIVGVFRNINNGEQFGSPTTPELISPLAQFPSPFTSMAIRTSGNPADMVKSIAAAIHTIDPEVPLANVQTMDQIIHARLGFDRFEAWIYGSFAGLALLLCAVGIYGLMAFVVSQRTPELGLRMALGATRKSIVQMILQDGFRLAAVGLVLGFGGAYYGYRIMQSSLYGTHVMSPGAIMIVGAVLMSVALAACIIPARRAASIEPMEALRTE